MTLAYSKSGIGGAVVASPTDIKALQHDLRSLGYLRRGIDGVFGDGTRAAIRAIQYDLLHNDGSGPDGNAPVAVMGYKGGVSAVTGVVDAALATCIEAMLLDTKFPKVPFSTDPISANASALSTIAGSSSTVAPIPYLLAIFRQESNSEHFAVPQSRADVDDYVIVGLDRNDKASKDRVTSRGYGIGQFTLFHHPATEAELASYVLNPVSNVRKAEDELSAKFHGFLVSKPPGPRALDRDEEHPGLPLRMCRYGVNDPRYMSDCKACARAAGSVTLGPGTPVYKGATQTYGQAQYYAPVTYSGVPDRASFQCDWPYAVRRYNGNKSDSYNYQAIVLRNLLTVPTAGA
jgi:peptidoglycan hydrolase-like protein with peptidoglycan-binding domain